MSEMQALDLYNRNIDLLTLIFENLKELSQASMFRFLESNEDICLLRCNLFNGFEMEDTITDIEIPEALLTSLRRHLRNSSVLFFYGSSLYNLSPFLILKEIDEGHRTAICMYKKTCLGGYEDEIVGRANVNESNLLVIKKENFNIELGELISLT